MATRPFIWAIEDPDADALAALSEELRAPFGMSRRDYATRDGPRNLRIARALSRLRSIHLCFSGEEHGADAYWLRGTVLEEIEIKTAQEGSQFHFYTDPSRETVDRLARYGLTSYLFGVFRDEQLVEAYYLPSGSGLNELFQAREAEIRLGAVQKRKAMGLRQVKGYGAVKLV